jgi:hypothetical protein
LGAALVAVAAFGAWAAAPAQASEQDCQDLYNSIFYNIGQGNDDYAAWLISLYNQTCGDFPG